MNTLGCEVLKVSFVDYAYFEDVKGYGLIIVEDAVLREMFEEGLLGKFVRFSKIPKREVESYLAKAQKMLEPIVEKLKVSDPTSTLYVYGSEDEAVRALEMTRPRVIVVEDGVAGKFEREFEEVEGVDVVRLSKAVDEGVSVDMGSLELPRALVEALSNMLSTYTNLVVRLSARERISIDEALEKLGLFKKPGTIKEA